MACKVDRRSFLKKSVAASAGAALIRGPEEAQLMAMLANPTDADRPREGASGKVPLGKIGKVPISRIIGGGNIISGWCHQRDLLYVSTLAGHYLTEEKQFDTLELMEEQGINTCSPDPSQMAFINKYKRERGGEIQTVVGVRQEWDDFARPAWAGLKEWIDRCVDDGATLIYTQGGYTERVMKSGTAEGFEIIARALQHIRQQGLPAGLGCHDVKVIESADQNGIVPDFYFKTFHHDHYWSAHPRDSREPWSVDSTRYVDHNKFHDNIYDLFPDQTQKIMAKKNQPWIAFKTLAAGAIHPQSAFEFCFKGGADFISVGMFDFQVLEDTLVARQTLEREDILRRDRPWCA